MTSKTISDRDMRDCHFLKSTCEIGDPPPPPPPQSWAFAPDPPTKTPPTERRIPDLLHAAQTNCDQVVAGFLCSTDGFTVRKAQGWCKQIPTVGIIYLQDRQCCLVVTRVLYYTLKMFDANILHEARYRMRQNPKGRHQRLTYTLYRLGTQCAFFDCSKGDRLRILCPVCKGYKTV